MLRLQPNPGMARTIFGNHERYQTGYFNPFPGYYFTGDGAIRDKVSRPVARLHQTAHMTRTGRTHMDHRASR